MKEESPIQTRVPALMKVLKRRDSTLMELFRECDFSLGQTEATLNYMRKENLCHVVDWKPTERGGGAAPVYRFGKGINVPMPKSGSKQASQMREYRLQAEAREQARKRQAMIVLPREFFRAAA